MMINSHTDVVDYTNIKFFKGLNALRFFAALLVVFHHGETIRKKNDLPNYEWLGFFKNGSNAVTFFFVLSGFLITYLLIKEIKLTQTISVKNFYLKRVLRIWPLYFLLVFIGTIALPYWIGFLNYDYSMPYSFTQTWYYFLFFLPGLVTHLFGHHLLEPLWSIGVEEVFYLIWAPLVKLAHKLLLPLLISVILIKVLVDIYSNYHLQEGVSKYLISIFQFDSMAIGGLGAYYLYYKGEKLTQSIFFQPLLQWVIIITVLVLITFQSNLDFHLWNVFFKTPVFSIFLINILFILLILYVACSKNPLVNLENKVLSYLGEISYGVYMYHMLVIFGVMLFFKKLLSELAILPATLIFYSLVIGLTILVASLSKHYLENYFLRWKQKITT
jgi:peptidoglycan/LPS O-acetylase OafA/YrhL